MRRMNTVVLDAEKSLGVKSRHEQLLERLEETFVFDSENGPALESCTHMLLVLNRLTWDGERGEALANVVRAARKANVEILLAHESDPAHNGCPFEQFFETTPPELIEAGLFAKIAIECLPAPFRRISLALLAKALGATPGGPPKPKKERGPVLAQSRLAIGKSKRQSTATAEPAPDAPKEWGPVTSQIEV